MDFLTRFGLSKARFTGFVMVLLVALGAAAYSSIPKREDPAVTVRTAAVIARFEGMSPERVENLIADPIERKIREIGEVEDIETVITYGQALFYVHLYDTVGANDVEGPWEDLRNKMQAVTSELPEGTSAPIVNTDYGDVAISTIAVTGDGFSLLELEDIAEQLQRELYTVPGITQVELFGVQDQRIWLELDTRRIAAVGIQMDQLLADLAAQNVILSAGEIDANGTNIVLEANGDIETLEGIRNVLTKVPGLAGYVRLSDLVEVRRGYVDPKVEPVFYNGEPAIVLSLEMAGTTDIQDLGARLKQKIPEFEQRQPIGVSYNISTFQEENVTKAVSGALINVGQTFLIVFAVMFLFLGLRPALVIACIVPFTLSIALIGMGPLGVDVQQVSIAAVIISLGLLVDNGLVVVEDIQGRVDAGMNSREAALVAGGQYAIPLGVASITTISAFVPMLLLDGTEGDFAYSLGAVVAIMLFGSWITALYILPFLSSVILKGKTQNTANKEESESRSYQIYGALVHRLLPFGILIICVVYLVVAFSASQLGGLKREQFPFTERSDLLIYMDMPKGTAISATEELALRAEAWLSDEAANPGVLNTTVYVGTGGPRFNLSLDPADPDPASAFFAINTSGLDASINTVNRARAYFVENFPEARFRVTRLAQGGTESGIVDVEITGPDADVLMAAAAKLERKLSTFPQVIKNESDWGNKVVKFVVDIDQDKARDFGITSEDISGVLASYFSGTQYSTFREDNEQIPIVLRATTRSRDSIQDLSNLSVEAGGQLISLDQIASLQPKLEFSEIRRENQVRRIVFSGKSELYSADELNAALQPEIEALELGPEYSVTIAGELESRTETNGQLASKMPLALGIMLAALIFQFNSLRRSLATLMTIPLIVIGAPYTMALLGQPLSFFATLGLMSLMGIIINNAIVLIDQIDIEMESKPLKDAIVSASKQRLRPILLTSLTTVCGLLPMVISGGALFQPMAVIMIGGLLVASPVSLLFVPSIYYLLMRFRSKTDGQEA
ncbi:multidrug transporter AcrB [Phaeobacter inhibens]|uniref:efflux RND transporter permease subunit n=1 Tax=Phaeobacter inhibens TaxID=221822 RepID=UPI0027698B24|nr:efflux RND transporter permease subunit [Phaeobacter inhibens]GLO69963.1 multidrug transporter AcrB [Phaeobacter inhibens]